MSRHSDDARSRALGVYVAAVALAGAAVLFVSARVVSGTPHAFGWIGLTLLALLAGSFRLRFASIAADIAIDDTFYIATALLFGPGPAAITIGAGGLAVSLRRRRSATQVAFNTAAFAVSMWTASHVFFWIAGVRPLALGHTPVSPLVVPLMTMAAVFYAVNSMLIAVAVGLDTRRSPLQIWQQHFGWIAIGYFGAASVAFILILLIQEASFSAIVVVLPLLAVFYLTFHLSFGREEDARRHVADMDRLYLSTVETLAMAIDAKDDVTHSHVRRVQAYATALAHAMQVSDEPTLRALEAAALLHDTGKLAVPEHILNKPGKLTPAEFEKMKLHADIGADILSLVRFPFPVEPIVRAHHENWDGSGYPRGLAGEDIPIGARILSVVDCFDALTSDRPYRRALSDDAAIQILRDRRGTMYDPRVVDTFIATYRDVRLEQEETPEQREVLRRISATKRADEPPPIVAAPEPMTHDLLAFVSLARVASGDQTLLDALGLASTLVAGIMPGVTGAWHMVDEGDDRLVVADTFGPHAGLLVGRAVDTGEGLTGWVAARRQPLFDADAALDLGHAAVGPLRRCMSVPLVAGDAIVGVLTLYSQDEAAFSTDRARLVQVVAPHLAATIHATMVRERRARHSAERGPSGRDLRLISTR